MSDSIPEILRQTDRRKPRAVLLILAGLTVGAVLMLGLLKLVHAIGDRGVVGDHGGLTSGQMGGTTSGSSPSSAMGGGMSGGQNSTATMSVEDALRMHIPEDIDATCQPGDDHHVASFSYFSVSCRPGGPVIEVQYSSFHDALALRFKFSQDLTAHGIGADASGCSSKAATGTSKWWTPESMGTDVAGAVVHTIGGHGPEGSTRGRVMCYLQDDRAWIEWFDGDTHIYGWASSSQDAYPELFNWWASEAGPFHPRMSSM